MAGGEAIAEAPGKAFERRVADAYRALGYQVTANVQLPGKQTDILARQDVGGVPTIKLAVECKDHAEPIGNDDVLSFISRVIAQTGSLEITAGVLVSSRGFTADARAAASGHRNVTLLSWEELISQLLDVRHQVRELVEHYESLDIFHDYLPLGIELLDWSSLTAEASRATELNGLLEDWRRFDGAAGIGALLVLADFGAGKTTLLRNLEYSCAKAYLAGEDTRIPLFVPLREFRDSQDVGALLRASFREAYYRDLPIELLWQRLEAGSFYVLFDGFDEMLDRSNASRRLELFRDLLPVLRSRSPAVLTSRPSYLVERGELDTLLSTLAEKEAAIAAPSSPRGSFDASAATRLRRKLVERYREVRPVPGANDPLNAREVQVARLLPLDQTRMEEFVRRHEDELRRAGASVSDLLGFIDRTYDLADLASRPMLLNLIISSVVEGGLDVNDTAVQYGASGLYEIYTHTKLDLDLAKGFNRQNGLSLPTRRMLAEALAIEMYRDNALELDFHEVLERLRAEPGPLREALDESGLSEEEIRTDFATCSFVTLDQSGKCRFVHKSFRGFFIARYLKAQLPRIDPMLNEPLEREVLYFLGGFAPTEPNVGEMLWARFLRTDDDSPGRKRNLLVAFLYAKPDHDTRKIVGAEISDAEFGRLAFDGTRLADVAWRDSTVMDIALTDGQWKDVRLVDSHFAQLTTNGGELSLDLRRSVFESWRCRGTTGRISLEGSTIHSWDVEGGSIRLGGEDSHVAQLRATDAELLCGGERPSISLGRVELAGSRLQLNGDWDLDGLRGTGSFIVHRGPQESVGGWALFRSILVLSRGPAEPASLKSPFDADRDSLVLASNGVHHSLLACGVGLYGSVQAASAKTPFLSRPRAWGVLEAESILSGLKLPAGEAGCRVGHLLLVRRKWYDEHVRTADRLAAVFGLEHAADGIVQVPSGAALHHRLELCRQAARDQYEALLEQGWPVISA